MVLYLLDVYVMWLGMDLPVVCVVVRMRVSSPAGETSCTRTL